MGNRPPVSSLNRAQIRARSTAPGSFGRGRRRGALGDLVPVEPAKPIAQWTESGAGYEPALQILHSILHSATDLVGAEQSFFLVARGDSVLEVACTRNMRPGDVIDTVLGRAAKAVHTSLRERVAACADGQGRPLPALDGFFEANSPSIVCLPLDLGLSQSGVLCLLRRKATRRVSELDLEILHALTEQAALAIGAASHQSALSRLEASLAALAPTRA